MTSGHRDASPTFDGRDDELKARLRWPEGIDVESETPLDLRAGETVRVKPGSGLVAHFNGRSGTVRGVVGGFMGITVDFACPGHPPHKVDIYDLMRLGGTNDE